MSTSQWANTSTPYLSPRAEGKSDPWATEAIAQGRRGGQRTVHAGEVPAPAEVAELLGAQEGRTVVALQVDVMAMPAHRQRLR